MLAYTFIQLVNFTHMPVVYAHVWQSASLGLFTHLTEYRILCSPMITGYYTFSESVKTTPKLDLYTSRWKPVIRSLVLKGRQLEGCFKRETT